MYLGPHWKSGERRPGQPGIIRSCAPVDERLYLARAWARDRQRRAKAKVPAAAVTFRKPWCLADEMLHRSLARPRTGTTSIVASLAWRFGGVAFVGASEVENRLADLGSTVRMAGGLGLRFALNKRQTINIRLDITCKSRGEFEKYLKLREAF